MGRIKTQLIKRVTNDIIGKHGDELSRDFAKNKEVLANVMNIPSKKIRNAVAGYAARLKKTEE